MPMYFHVPNSSSPPENFGMLSPILQVSQAKLGLLPPVTNINETPKQEDLSISI